MDPVFAGLETDKETMMEGADIVFANLEGPIRGEGRKGGTSMVFAFNRDIAPFLKDYGFNVLSIANNHAVDAGWDGRAETMEVLKEGGIAFCGHPSEADYDSVYFGESGEVKFAFICFNDIRYKLGKEKAKELIKKVKEEADIVLVSIHWGYEYVNNPHHKVQVEAGRELIDAGADVIIGHHPHVIQSFEIYNGKLIFYSIGNFIFDQYWSGATQEGLGLKLFFDLNGGDLKTTVDLIPMKSKNSQPRVMTSDEYSNWAERFLKYSDYSEEIRQMVAPEIK